MIQTNNLYLAKLLGNDGSRFGYRYEVDNKYRLFYLTKKRFFIDREDVFKDVETGKCYPLCFSYYSKFYINTNNMISLRDAFPTVNFPTKLTKKQMLQISNLFNEMQCEEYNKKDSEIEKIELHTAAKIKTKVIQKHK